MGFLNLMFSPSYALRDCDLPFAQSPATPVLHWRVQRLQDFVLKYCGQCRAFVFTIEITATAAQYPYLMDLPLIIDNGNKSVIHFDPAEIFRDFNIIIQVNFIFVSFDKESSSTFT